MSGNVEGQNTSPEVEEQQQVNVNDLVSRLDQLEQSNKRLLDESKTWKSKYQAERSKAEEREHATLKESNDFKGLYEKTLDEVANLKQQLGDTTKSKLETDLRYEVAKYGRDAEDVDILLAAVKTKKKDLLGYDSDVQGWRGVDLAVDELRKTNPGLFKVSIPGMENGRPQAAVAKEKTVDELIDDNPSAVLKDVLSKIL